ncbi:hypothetical protein H9Q72_000613 [Fusarium xylarioides]|uniref:Integral membrane protein n=1 Tax=Fusarium xylarioides TaxID=221167 RepID=A0A9P7L6N5_9HYPO|nr:hypothetical protein H9Q72_000613 [Fusarium xylarioides]
MIVGRVIGVLLPFALALAAAIFTLVPALAGVTDKSLYLIQLNFENLSISPASELINKILPRAKTVKKNITAELLGLNKTYDITLWGFCHTDTDNKRECSSPKFNWVRKNISTDNIKSVDKDIEVRLPKEIKAAIQTFRSITKGAEVTFIVAMIELAIEIALGIFAVCSRELTCWTWMASGLASAFVLASAILSTIMASVSIGAVETTAKLYGVKGKVNIVFLAIIWIGAALAIAANLLWIIPTLCCSSTTNRKHPEGKGLLERSHYSGAYAPIDDDHEMQPTYHNRGLAPSPRTDLAYEPYSHQV